MILAITMSFVAAKSTCACLWLIVVLLGLGCAQDASTNSQAKASPSNEATKTSIGDLAATYIRSKRALNSCLVPPQPGNGEWKLHRSLCTENTADCELPQGTMLEPGSLLIYRCASGYKLRGNTEVYCARSGNWSRIPVCVEANCDPLNSASTIASCISPSGEKVNCDSAVPPGTRAQVSCRSGYKKITRSVTTRNNTVECKPNGEWEVDLIRCTPVCGKTIAHQTPFMINGSVANISEFPWHATLYRQRNTTLGSKKEFICGATIIQPNLVVTAAHCVYDELTRTTLDPSLFFVIAGNVHRDYDSPLHDPRIVKNAAVKNVYTYCQYYGIVGNYATDIAVLELQEPFVLSETLLPACLEVQGDSAQILGSGSLGKLSGFGRTADSSNSTVETVSLPYVSYNRCKSSLSNSFDEIFISNDKFCAGYTNGTALCDISSGGGLVFEKDDLWYIMGISSVALSVDLENGEKTCDTHSYTLFTRVASFMSWIQSIMYELERYNYFKSCE